MQTLSIIIPILALIVSIGSAYFTYRNFKKSASIQQQINALEDRTKERAIKHPDRPSFKPVPNKMSSNDIYNG